MNIPSRTPEDTIAEIGRLTAECGRLRQSDREAFWYAISFGVVAVAGWLVAFALSIRMAHPGGRP